MPGRPEILFPLFGALDGLKGIGPKTAKLLAALEIDKPRDLLFTLPHGVIDRTRRDTVQGAVLPGVVTVAVTVERHHPARAKGRPYRITVNDAETSFQLVFFHAREDWLKRTFPVGEQRLLSGKAEFYDGIVQMPHPDYVLDVDEDAALPRFEPVYRLTAGVTQKLMRTAVQDLLKKTPGLPEWADGPLLTARRWPAWADAVAAAHSPQSGAEARPDAPARARLAYDELFAHQLTLALARGRQRSRKGRPSTGDGALQQRVLSALPYAPTAAQTRAVAEIMADMGGPARMHRLLQGDVGSGKTLVAMMALLRAVEAGGQGAMMAPTEILARQHHAALRPLADSARVVIELLTGRDKGRERAAKLAALERGDIGILVGTHAIFQDDVAFADLRLAVVDEQHRFGVRQRLALGAKGDATDVLVMTATPIPRSLALAQYGDLDVSVLDEKPPGRTPVTTALVSDDRLDEVVAHLEKAIAEGRQAYWVCPLVNESEVTDLAAAEDRARALRVRLGEAAVTLVHGQMPPAEKDAAMAAFASGEKAVLVATTVIEVGVDVPNASIMVIERAERFGLAQLHQLRGRVGRGAAASTCLLLYGSPLGEAARSRLTLMRETEDGFRIAEADLALRGAGDVLGHAQSGLPRFRIADLERDTGLMEIAQSDARRLVADDPGLATDRGQAARVLLYLMEQDKAIQLLGVG